MQVQGHGGGLLMEGKQTEGTQKELPNEKRLNQVLGHGLGGHHDEQEPTTECSQETPRQKERRVDGRTGTKVDSSRSLDS